MDVFLRAVVGVIRLSVLFFPSQIRSSEFSLHPIKNLLLLTMDFELNVVVIRYDTVVAKLGFQTLYGMLERLFLLTDVMVELIDEFLEEREA